VPLLPSTPFKLRPRGAILPPAEKEKFSRLAPFASPTPLSPSSTSSSSAVVEIKGINRSPLGGVLRDSTVEAYLFTRSAKERPIPLHPLVINEVRPQFIGLVFNPKVSGSWRTIVVLMGPPQEQV